MTKLYISLLRVAAFGSFFWACSEQEPTVRLGMDPDAKPVSNLDARIAPDIRIDDAAPVIDMAITGDLGPMDLGIPGYVVDVPPEEHPTSDEYVVIGGGDVWF